MPIKLSFLPTNFNSYKPHKLYVKNLSSDSPTPLLPPINGKSSMNINDVRFFTNSFTAMAREDEILRRATAEHPSHLNFRKP